MTTYTSPKTWATNDLATASEMNTYIRDNIMHLDETKTELACTAVLHDASPDTTTSTSADDLSSDLSITTTATSDVICIALVKAKFSNNTYTATIGLHNGTALGETQVLENEAWFLDYHTYTFISVLESAAAGTHTFKIQGLVNNASNTLTVDDVIMVAFALSE